MDVISILRKRCSGKRQKDVAHELGISEQYLSDVLNERTEPGAKILAPLGIERVVTYRRKRA